MFSLEIYIKLGTLPSHKMKIFVKKCENLSESEVQMLGDHVVCRLLRGSSGPHLTYGFLQPQLKCVVKKAQKWKKVNACRADGSEQNLA